MKISNSKRQNKLFKLNSIPYRLFAFIPYQKFQGNIILSFALFQNIIIFISPFQLNIFRWILINLNQALNIPINILQIINNFLSSFPELKVQHINNRI